MNNFSELDSIINKNYKNTCGIVVQKDCKILYENYYNNQNSSSKTHIFSATKSIFSMLLGIAIDKGFIKDENQKVLDFFPEYIPQKNNVSIKDITIRDIITMTAPYRFIFTNYSKYFMRDDWVIASLEQLGGKKKIERISQETKTYKQGSLACKFKYAGLIGPDILSGILTKATASTVIDFAQQYLFKPLGIDVNKSIVFNTKEEQFAFYKNKNNDGWVADLKGHNCVGWGLNLSTQDMTKLGQLYLDKGMYQGKQIVSSSWVEKSTHFQSYCTQFKLYYGYMWWLLDDDSFAAMGDGGNMIYVNRAKNIVISMTALLERNAKIRIDLVKEIEALIS